MLDIVTIIERTLRSSAALTTYVQEGAQADIRLEIAYLQRILQKQKININKMSTMLDGSRT